MRRSPGNWSFILRGAPQHSSDSATPVRMRVPNNQTRRGRRARKVGFKHSSCTRGPDVSKAHGRGGGIEEMVPSRKKPSSHVVRLAHTFCPRGRFRGAPDGEGVSFERGQARRQPVVLHQPPQAKEQPDVFLSTLEPQAGRCAW